MRYIESTLNSHYTKRATFKEAENSSVVLYQNNNNDKYVVKIWSCNVNDDVFRTLRGVKNRNFVTVYEICNQEKGITVLEEYVEGMTLEEIMKDGTLDRKTACSYALQLCDALTTLHAFGIVHRDIKPSNVIIKDDGTAVLIDFSIARLIKIKEKDTQALGTPGYAAPEQFGIAQSLSSADIYGLGVLLNMMLTGVHPSVDSPKGFIKKVIQKSTSTQISKRYSNAIEFKKAIQRSC